MSPEEMAKTLDLGDGTLCCDRATAHICYEHEQIAMMIERATKKAEKERDAAILQIRALVDLVPHTRGAHTEGFPCDGCVALKKLGIERKSPFESGETEKTWAEIGVDLAITHLNGYPLKNQIVLKQGDRLQVNGKEVLGPDTKLALSSDPHQSSERRG
jgi:hypothetical protein